MIEETHFVNAPPTVRQIEDKAICETERRIITERIETDEFDTWLSYDGFLAWMQKHIEEVPPEYQASIRFKPYVIYDYGDHSAGIEITWLRPETDDEVLLRINERVESHNRKEAEERRQLQLLKAKYG